MAKTEKTYPEWVQKYRTKGMMVRKNGNSYYLYKRTSKRVPGKKYPQPIDRYVGVITPEGIIESKNRKVGSNSVEVWEYGFSKAILDLCPDGWKTPLGDEWEDVLKVIICNWSDASYFHREKLKDRNGFRCRFNVQAASLSRCIRKEHKVDIKELAPLKNIYLVKIGKEKVISRIEPEQEALLGRLGLKLEV